MKKIIIILVVLLVGSGLLIVKVRKNQIASAKPAKILPVVVDTMKLEKKPVTLTLPVMGIIASNESTTLSTKISGRVKDVYKQEGELVKKGDILAAIDASDLVAKKRGILSKKQGLGFQIIAGRDNIKALDASLVSAIETHSRTEELLKVKGASMEQFRQEESAIANINAKLSAAKNGIFALQKNQESLNQNIKEIENLITYATILSPISGTLSKRMIMPGDMTMPGKALFHITAGSGLYINLSLPDSIKSKKIIYNGIEYTLVTKNQATQTGLIQYLATIPNGSGFIEGQYVNIHVVIYEGNTTLVPMDGILNIAGNSYVYIIANKKPVRTPVKIIARGSEGLVVDYDLSGKTIIIAKPDILLRVSAGVPILPVEKNVKKEISEIDHGGNTNV